MVLPVLAALAVIAATTAWLLPGLLGGAHQAASTTPTAATPVLEAPTPAAEPTSSATTAGSTAVVPTAAQPTPLPEPSPTAAPAPTAVPVPSTPASTIRDISWAQQGDVAVITMRADGSLGKDRVAVDLLGDPPRVLVRVKGITKPYPQLEIPVGTATVAKIRVGHHAEVSPPALYVVLDLASEGLKVKSVEAAGGELRITVGR